MNKVALIREKKIVPEPKEEVTVVKKNNDESFVREEEYADDKQSQDMTNKKETAEVVKDGDETATVVKDGDETDTVVKNGDETDTVVKNGDQNPAVLKQEVAAADEKPDEAKPNNDADPEAATANKEKQ